MEEFATKKSNLSFGSKMKRLSSLPSGRSKGSSSIHMKVKSNLLNGLNAKDSQDIIPGFSIGNTSFYKKNSESASTFVDIDKIEGNAISKLKSEIKVKGKNHPFGLDDPILTNRRVTKQFSSSCQGKFCGKTYCKECLYFKYRIYKLNGGVDTSGGLDYTDYRICRICHAKFIMKDQLVSYIDKVKLMDDEIEFQIKEYESSGKFLEELNLQLKMIQNYESFSFSSNNPQERGRYDTSEIDKQYNDSKIDYEKEIQNIHECENKMVEELTLYKNLDTDLEIIKAEINKVRDEMINVRMSK